jgi:hypothetical protein
MDISTVLDLVTRETHIVEPVPVPVSAADFVVTGDRALLRASGFQGLEIVTPREFARRHLER